MDNDYASQSEVLAKFRQTGFMGNHLRRYSSEKILAFFSSTRILRTDLPLILRFAHFMGEDNFAVFLSAAKIMKSQGKKEAGVSSQALTTLIYKIGVPLSKIINEPVLKGCGGVRLREGEKPFLLGIELPAVGQPFFRFFFTPKMRRGGKAGIVLGNFHVTNSKTELNIEKKFGIGHFPEFIIDTFASTFLYHNASVVAANTKMHLGYQWPYPVIVLNKIKTKMGLNPMDVDIYVNSPEFQRRLGEYAKKHGHTLARVQEELPLDQSKASRAISKLIDGVVEAEMKRIKSTGEVAQKIAYSKAGFRVKKRRIRQKVHSGWSHIIVTTKKTVPHWHLK